MACDWAVGEREREEERHGMLGSTRQRHITKRTESLNHNQYKVKLRFQFTFGSFFFFFSSSFRFFCFCSVFLVRNRLPSLFYYSLDALRSVFSIRTVIVGCFDFHRIGTCSSATVVTAAAAATVMTAVVATTKTMTVDRSNEDGNDE